MFIVFVHWSKSQLNWKITEGEAVLKPVGDIFCTLIYNQPNWKIIVGEDTLKPVGDGKHYIVHNPLIFQIF